MLHEPIRYQCTLSQGVEKGCTESECVNMQSLTRSFELSLFSLSL